MSYQQQHSPLAPVEKMYYQLQANYFKKIPSKTLQDGAIKGMLNSLNDPYSLQLTGQNQTDVNNVLEGSSYSGVGIQMKIADGKVLVDSLVRDSPAAKSNIKPGDQLIKVNDYQVSPDHLDQVVEKVRGKNGSKVTLQLKRDNRVFKVTLKRTSLKQSMLSVRTQGKATIITISQFDSNTAKDLKATLKKINPQKTPKLIIDLQDNPGGVMSDALTCAAYFVPNGKTLMQYQSRQEKQVIKSSKKLAGGYKTQLKPIILINKNTASASEIFTAALVQNKRAVTVGQTTYGKGTVQEVGTSQQTEYKYTVAKWLTPNGNWINHQGLKPTYYVKPSPLANLSLFHTKTTLKEIMTGLDIVILQQYLEGLGFLTDHLTGIFDEQTKQAVIAFQKANSLPATGEVNQNTEQELYFTAGQKLQNDNPALKKALSLNY
ncbi:PDZ domain-containing protein [Lactobacillus sp. PV034]|nr:S41 family peptidase [Lactobacillus sp. PV034]QNQ81508.1 PDZ domain-containing protein [Lactobacillus sp. PV034]